MYFFKYSYITQSPLASTLAFETCLRFKQCHLRRFQPEKKKKTPMAVLHNRYQKKIILFFFFLSIELHKKGY